MLIKPKVSKIAIIMSIYKQEILLVAKVRTLTPLLLHFTKEGRYPHGNLLELVRFESWRPK